MSNVLEFRPGTSLENRGAGREDASRHRRFLSARADRIEAATNDPNRNMVKRSEERLVLAKNLWLLLEDAIRKNAGLTKARIAQQAGQGGPDESTKRLYKLVMDPELAPEKQRDRARGLLQHIKAYKDVARAASELSGLDHRESLVRLVRGTSYEERATEAQSGPFDDAFADILVSVEDRLSALASNPSLGEYFELLRRHKLTLAVTESGNIEGQETIQFVAAYGAWETEDLRSQSRRFVSARAASCIPKAIIGRGHVKTVAGSLVMRLGEGVSAWRNNKELPLKNDRLRVPAQIDVNIDVALAMATTGGAGSAEPVLLVSPVIRVRVPNATEEIALWRKGSDGIEDFTILHANDEVDERAAIAEAWYLHLDRDVECNAVDWFGDKATELGLLAGLSYSIDVEPDDPEIGDLVMPFGAAVRIEPLTLSSQRRWLLREMRNKLDDWPIDVALPEWVSSPYTFEGTLERSLLTAGRMSLEEGSLSEGEKGRRQQLPARIAGDLERVRGWRKRRAYDPVTCPEGTLAAALERGLFQGEKYGYGPALVIQGEFKELSRMLQRDLEAARQRRRGGAEVGSEDSW